MTIRRRCCPTPGSIARMTPTIALRGGSDAQVSTSTARSCNSTPNRTRRCSGCCASSSGSPAPSTAAASRNAARAPCTSTACRRAAACVRYRSVARERRRSSRSKGLSADGSHPVQKAWVALDVPQCGYCQSRHDHGGGGAAQGQRRNPTDADIDEAMTNICRCGTYNRVRAAIKAAAAGGDAKSAGLGDPARRREHDMTHRNRSISRRRFLAASAGVGRQARRRLPHSRSPARRAAQAAAPRTGDQCLGRGQARRHGRHPHRALRDGPGNADRPRAARRRGARLRLGEGHDRVSDAGREPRAQSRLGQLLDRRQPRHPRFAGVRAQGRRDGPRDARAGGRGRVEGARRRMRRPRTA